MYKIGEFSKITGLSVKALRFYDEIGLLKPSFIDNNTNYRYYGDNELENYKKIQYLKKIGFSLDEIKDNLNNLTIEALENKKQELKLKRDYLSFQIDEINKLVENNKVKKIICPRDYE